jgi:hypothetical protein
MKTTHLSEGSDYYNSPAIEILEISVEKGLAASVNQSNYTDVGHLEDGEEYNL